MSDRHIPFKNNTIRMVLKALNVSHRFTQQFGPWLNGSIYSLVKDLANTFRAILSKLHVKFE